jgi:hypothetical protein
VTSLPRVEWAYRYYDTPTGYCGPTTEANARAKVDSDLSAILLRREVLDGPPAVVGDWVEVEDQDTEGTTCGGPSGTGGCAAWSWRR